jgi:hypothetical protein
MNARRIATIVVGTEIAFAAAFGASGVIGWHGAAYAQPACFDAHWSPIVCPVDEVSLSEIRNVDALPVCSAEDCSDQPGQVGMWLDRDTGDWYLSVGQSSLLIIDDTVVAR